MEGEKIHKKHEGDKYLGLLGLGHLGNREITTGDVTIQARDFLDVCGEHARPMLVGFEAMSQDDDKYEPTKETLKNFIENFIGQYVGEDNPS
jgi:hypothetical protein